MSSAVRRARVLLVAPPSSFRIAAYLEAAAQMGIELLVASEGSHSMVSAVAAGLHVDLQSPGALAVLLKAGGPDGFSGVVATDDIAVMLASQVAEALGLPHNPEHAVLCTRRKDLARAALLAAGEPVPEFRIVHLDRPIAPQLDGVLFPCVVKPVALSGSRGVIRADHPAALLDAIGRVRGILRSVKQEGERDRVLVESYLPGVEVAVEAMLERGRLRLLAVFDKPDPLEGPFFEETYYVTPSRLPASDLAEVERRMLGACRAYGLREGPVHGELRVHRGRAVLVELAARTIGGQCARLLRFSTGQGLEQLVLAHATGLPVPLRDPDEAAGVLMIPIERGGILRRVEGVTDASRVPGIDEVLINVREGYELVPLPEGDSYLGFVFARAVTAERVEDALRRAHAHLRVVTAPVLASGDRDHSVDPPRRTADGSCGTCRS